MPRAQEHGKSHAIIAGTNYGQGSSREHAALAPHFLGLRLVIAGSFARIHAQNLVNFGILPLTVDSAREQFSTGDELLIEHPAKQLREGKNVIVVNTSRSTHITASHLLSSRQQEVLSAGGLIPWIRGIDSPAKR